MGIFTLSLYYVCVWGGGEFKNIDLLNVQITTVPQTWLSSFGMLKTNLASQRHERLT